MQRFILNATSSRCIRSVRRNLRADGLSGTTPNPFNAATTIAYRVNSAEFVEIALYNVLGRTLRTLVAEDKTAATYVYRLVLDDAPSGVYFCRLTAGGQTYTQQLLLLR
ncbi:MAG: T9SS type A sorting domain-containing protein [Bacteroidota bacterium]|jgi:serine protease AprX